MGDKKPRFRLSPELSDGSSSCIVDSEEAVLAAVKEWLVDMKDCGGAGESCWVMLVHMTDEDFENLPEL